MKCLTNIAFLPLFPTYFINSIEHKQSYKVFFTQAEITFFVLTFFPNNELSFLDKSNGSYYLLILNNYQSYANFSLIKGQFSCFYIYNITWK